MSTTTDLIDKIAQGLVSIAPKNGKEHAILNVAASLLTGAADELSPILEKHIAVDLLIEGLENIETGIDATVKGGEQVNEAMRGPKTGEPTATEPSTPPVSEGNEHA